MPKTMMGDGAPTSGSTAANKLNAEGGVDADDIALDILMDDNLFESMNIDDLIRKSDPTHIDRLFLGHMKQELWKAVGPKGQQQNGKQKEGGKNLKPLQPQEVPTTPSTAASTTTSAKGRTRARFGPIVKAKETAVEKKQETQGERKSRQHNTFRVIKAARNTGKGEKGKDEEREATAAKTPVAEAEQRQPSAAGICEDGLAFEDGTGDPPASEKVFLDYEKGSDNQNSVKASSKAEVSTKDVQMIVSAVEAQFADKFDSIQSTLKSLGSKQQSLTVSTQAIVKSAEAEDQLTPQKLEKITSVMEEHFAPRFDTIEGSLSSIQQTLAALTTSLAQMHHQTPPPPPPLLPPPPPQQKTQQKGGQEPSLPIPPCNAVAPLSKSPPASECQAKTLPGERGRKNQKENPIVSADVPSMKKTQHSTQHAGNPEKRFQRKDSDPLQFIAEVRIDVAEEEPAAIVPSSVQKECGNTLQGIHTSQQVSPTLSSTTSGKLPCKLERHETLTPNSSTTNALKSHYKALDCADSQIAMQDMSVSKEISKSKLGKNKIISRAKMIMAKMHHAPPSPAKKQNLQSFEDNRKPSEDEMEWSQEGRMEPSHSFSGLSFGADLLRERVRNVVTSTADLRTPDMRAFDTHNKPSTTDFGKSNTSLDMEFATASILHKPSTAGIGTSGTSSDMELPRASVLHNSNNTTNLGKLDTSSDMELPTPSALRIRRLKYRPARATLFEEESREDTYNRQNCSRIGEANGKATKRQDNWAAIQPGPAHKLKSSMPKKESIDSQRHRDETQLPPAKGERGKGMIAGLNKEFGEQDDEPGHIQPKKPPPTKSPFYVQPVPTNLLVAIPPQEYGNSHSCAADQTQTLQQPINSRFHFEDTTRMPQNEYLGFRRMHQRGMRETSPSWAIPTPASLVDAEHNGVVWSSSSRFESSDIPASISVVDERLKPDDTHNHVNNVSPAISAPDSSLLEIGTGVESAVIPDKSTVPSLLPTVSLMAPNTPPELEMERECENSRDLVSLTLSAHPSDEEDELMAQDTLKDLETSNTLLWDKINELETSKKGRCEIDGGDEDAMERINNTALETVEQSFAQPEIKVDLVALMRSPDSSSLLTDEEDALHLRTKALVMPTAVGKTASQDSSMWPQDECRPKDQFDANATGSAENVANSCSEVPELYPTAQPLPEYRCSPNSAPFNPSLPPLPTSRISNNVMQCSPSIKNREEDTGEDYGREDKMMCSPSIKDKEEEGETGGEYEEEARSSQEYASPANSILETVPPTKTNVDTDDNAEDLKTIQENADGVTAHPLEILVQEEELLLTPGVSTVSNSVYTARSPTTSPQEKQSSRSPSTVDCCSPSSPLHFLQAESILRDILQQQAKKGTQTMNPPSSAKSRVSVGSFVWANSGQAMTSNGACADENNKLMLPHLDALPQNNPAFAIIAQKIAEAEAALKAELARDSIRKKSKLDVEGEDDAGSLDDERTNMEICIPNPRHQHSATARAARPRSPGPTTTIMTDNDNRYIELVHMNSAALFDQPTSPGASFRSTTSASSSEHEAGTKKPRVSFIERFQARHHEGSFSPRNNQYKDYGRPETGKRMQNMGTAHTKRAQQQRKGKKIPKGNERYAIPDTCSQSIASAAPSSPSIHWGFMDSLNLEENAEQDAAQIFEIVERYYHYHRRYRAGNPEHFSISLEERKKEPLDKLLSWTMVAFEEIEKDFLTSFQDKALADQQLDKTLFVDNRHVNNYQEEEEEDVFQDIDDDHSTSRLTNMGALEQVGMFDLTIESNTNSAANSHTNSNTHSRTGTSNSPTGTSYEDEEDVESTLFSDEDDTSEKQNSVSSDLYSMSRGH